MTAESAAAGSPPTGPLEIEIALRWGDMDINGHINNVQFARILEEGRVRAFTRWFPGDGGGQPSVVVVRQDIEFRAPLHYSTEPVRLTLAISRLGATSYTIGAILESADGVLAAVARTVLVVVDPATGRPMPIPDGVRAILAAGQADLPGPRPV
ncbi:MAG: thioesterase family protein [Gordonia sp. (in: high G+C Gram-positive bacteria)]